MADKNKIIVLCCENSALKAVDNMGTMEMMKSVDIVRLPCSGKVEVGLVLKCFESGYRGVVVLGCPLDNCKFIKGNYRAKKRIASAKRSLQEAGINEDRVRMDFISSVDTHKVVAIIEEMNAAIT
jgi:F420-non-reducing hydrogenase iron-sulfur subunit